MRGVMFPNFKLEEKIPVSSTEWFIQFFKHSKVNSLKTISDLKITFGLQI